MLDQLAARISEAELMIQQLARGIAPQDAEHIAQASRLAVWADQCPRCAMVTEAQR